MRFFILWIVALAALAGCSGGASGAYPTFDPTIDDWCHTFDFHADAQGFAISAGEQNILGLQTDESGVLQISYGYDRNLVVDTVIISVRRPPVSIGAGDITVRADGVVFNVRTQLWDAVLPAEIEQIYIPYSNTGPINEGADNSSINVYLEANHPLVIESIQVRGSGGSPFPENECRLTTNTPTPDPGTPEGSQTPTATGTPSPAPTSTGATNTPGPSPTPVLQEFEWKLYNAPDDNIPDNVTFSNATLCDINFYSGNNRGVGPTAWMNNMSCGSVVWTTPSALGHFIVDLGGAVNVTEIQLGWRWCCGSGVDAYINNALIESDYAAPQANLSLPDLTYSTPFTDADGIIDIGWDKMYLDYVRIIYSTDGEPTITPAPTNTPGGPTNTPGPTNTSSPLWGACLDFTLDPFGFSGADSTYEIDEGFTQDEDVWGFGRSGMAAGRKTKLRIKFKAGQSFTGDIRLSDGVNYTATRTVSGNTVTVDFTGDTHIPTTTLFIEFDGNNIPLTAQQLCWFDPNPPTRTPMPSTGTPPSRTPYPFSSPTATATSYRTPIAPSPFVLTSTPGVYITRTSTYGGSGGTPSASGTPGTSDGTGSGIPQGSGDAGDVLLALWDIGSGLFKVGGAYLGQVADVGGGIISAVNSAQPQAISGLPQCMTNPRAHDICAIYWILDWTLFAPSTPGALIIPMLLVLMNFMIVVRFMRWGWKIVSRGEDMANE